MVARRKWPFPPTPLSRSRDASADRALEVALERNTAVQGKRSSERTVNARPRVQRQRPAATLLRKKTGSR
jgi:hypothetical protein